ncbi:Ent-kaurene oxidase, chloroplastic [Heracleum sosnowskyi]|uniref:Ent-kaurene oxidase, chloroplastic n=1 Tax=Heracleum sosnowskyi TaxID=360622 RepID=A0AAD8J109_9APIA|nr:Ent-kaurene oxidase, chloroplastic [Heracleum sosnowskyi]
MDVVVNLQAMGAPAVAVGGISLLLIKRFVDHNRNSPPDLPPLPEVPGMPLIGNLLQLKEKKPHKTFAKWAVTYGPIYSIKTGSTNLVVLNSNDVAKEAMVTRFPEISTRKLSKALDILVADKSMVAISDYDEFHKTAKRYLLTHILGPNAQRQQRIHRDTLIENTSNQLHALSKNFPLKSINFRELFELGLFGLAMKQTLGEDVESVYVDELQTTMSRYEMFNCLVRDPMVGAIDVDWRDFFPYLKWIPNKRFENKIEQMNIHKAAIMKSLVQRARKQSSSTEGMQCYLDYLDSEGKMLSEKQIQMLIWEVIIETADTTVVATEWALFELAKDLKRQERLYEEISRVCGSDKITEEKLPDLPYLYAIFQETLRVHSPVPIIPLRYVHEHTQLGGYFVPSGSEIAINIYGCNMDKNVWENPEQWNPERFMNENSDPMDLQKTMAFGGGKRVCAGALEAMTISRLAIGRLIQEFEWRLTEGQADDVDIVGLTARKLQPMLAILKPRSRLAE